MGYKLNPFTGNFDIAGSSGAATPGGADTQVQYNDNGAFGGDTNLTWDKNNLILGLGDGAIVQGAGSVSLQSGGDGGQISISAANGTSSNSNGGNFAFNTGAGTGAGAGGNGVFQASDGGDTGNGGEMNFNGGNSGTQSGNGGLIQFAGGNAMGSVGNGGDLTFAPGNKASSGTVGHIIFVDPSNIKAIIDTSALASSDKTFTYPNTSGTLALTSNFASGTYAPTRSAEANLDSNVTMSVAQYLRVGNTVTVSGRFTADPTTTTTATSFETTLPIASNVGTPEDIAGVAFCGNVLSQGAEVIGVAANNTAKVQWVAGDVTSQTWSYTYTYRVI